MVSLLSIFRYAKKINPSNLKGLKYVSATKNVEVPKIKIQGSNTPCDIVVIKNVGKRVFGISESSLNRGVQHLTGSAAEDTRALKPIIEECYVGIKTKDDILKIFKRQGDEIASDRAVYILSPTPAKNLERNIGTSNAYMSEMYRQANSTGTIVDTANISKISEQILKNGEKKITIVVPDDFAGSGRSMIVNTAEALRNAHIPEGVEIELMLSPMSATPYAKKALETFSKYDGEGLMNLGVLNKDKLPGKNAEHYTNDSEIIRDFLNKFKDRIKIKYSKNIIDAKPYNETGAYLQLKATNPDAAQAIDILMTGSGKGYGRVGSSGTIVLMPGENGILKTPNNNCYGALPFALLEGASIKHIKNPNHKWSGKKWEFHVKKIAHELGVI